MSSLNRILLIGYVETTPEVRVTNAGDSFAKFTLRVPRPERQDGFEGEPDLIEIVGWRERAEVAGKLSASDLVLIDGRITTRTTEDPETGKRKYFTEIEARDIKSMVGGGSAAPIASAAATGAPSNDIANLPDFSAPKVSLEEKPAQEVAESDFNFGNAEGGNQGLDNTLEEEVPF